MAFGRPQGLARHMAAFVFWTALVLSALSLWLLPVVQPYSWMLLALSVTLNLWSLYKSDHGGFVRSRHAPRSKEPLRHFTALQTASLFFLLLAQLGLTVYLLVESRHLVGALAL